MEQNYQIAGMVLNTFLSIIVLYCLNGPSAAAVRHLKALFDNFKMRNKIVYTVEEEAQHFSRFMEELSKQFPFSSEDGLAALYDDTKPAIIQSLVDEINSKQDSWTASAEQERFKGASISDAKMLCGTWLEKPENVPQKGYSTDELQDLPASFNATEEFKLCSNVIGHIRDQSACGSCWAIAPTEAFNDRLCIKSAGKFTSLLSPGNVIACMETSGCHGGSSFDAWQWLHTTGVVTGGDYSESMTESDGCWPYSFPPCAHYTNATVYPTCPKTKYDSPKCTESCPNHKYPISMERDRHFVQQSLSALRSINDIKKEIQANGPVSASYLVYDDFLLMSCAH